MKVRTRFAPSPTGALHIGNARTALFNYLFAKHHNGEFLLRIEDTDRERSLDEHVDTILHSLEWLNLEFDGEPISQFSRLERHKEVAQELISKGKAYYCYCTPEELQAMREEAQKEGKHFRYPGIWRDRSPEDVPNGIDPVVRIKAPQKGNIAIRDNVQGNVSIQAEEIDDFIIMRSDGTPTYLHSVVVDDHDMEITHVIRGDDHLTNTFKQKIIYDAMGWETPEFAHVSLIHGQDGKKMSKRHGATGVDDYKAMGILPEAMNNYLLRLGWGHGDEEIIPHDRAIELFTLEDIGRSAARFDVEKLKSLNSHYINEKPNEELVTLILPLIDAMGATISDQARIWILKGMDDLKDRAKTLNDLAEAALFYTKTLPLDYDEKARNFLTPDFKSTLEQLSIKFSVIEQFEEEQIQKACKDYSNDNDIKMKDVMMPLRSAVVGSTVSPNLGKVIEIMGKEEVLERLRAAIEL